MYNITVDEKNRTIAMSKKFAAAAKRFGSDAYNQLQDCRKDYPAYRVIVRCTSGKKRDSFKGLTYDFMEKYIASHDDGNGSIMKKFNDLRGTSDEAKDLEAGSMSYGEIKAWFFQQYPVFAEFQKKRESMLAA